jgi:sulfite exporter TauE/SafE
MIGAVNLWEPNHVTFTVDLVTAFLLGLVHGITPDEHTWPITFSYAIGSHSTRRGLIAGLIFSLAFTAQQAMASELAHLGLAHWFTFAGLDEVVYVIVGVVMAVAGLFIMGRGLPHLHLLGWAPNFAGAAQPRELKPWMPAVHGFIAGWGLDAFSLIIYTTLAPAMPSAATGWLPGLLFGLGTLCVQGVAGAVFGTWAARRGLPPQAIRNIALFTAARTLAWGGCAFILYGILALAFPGLEDFGITTPLHVHNLHTLGLPFVLVLFSVVGVGVTTFVRATQAWRRRLLTENPAPVTLNP